MLHRFWTKFGTAWAPLWDQKRPFKLSETTTRLWISDFRFQVLDFGCWIFVDVGFGMSDFGCWIVDFGRRTLDFGIWVWDSVIT